MKNRLNRGFTLIELLVVIAIIGILSSVVLASLNTARTKGADAAVKADMNGIRSQAEIVYDDDGDYDAVCADTVIDKQLTAAETAGGGTAVCIDAADAWAASAPLKTAGQFWCVDSTGTSEQGTAAASTTVCP